MSDKYSWTAEDGLRWVITDAESSFPHVQYELEGQLRYAGGSNGEIAVIRQLLRLSPLLEDALAALRQLVSVAAGLRASDTTPDFRAQIAGVRKLLQRAAEVGMGEEGKVKP